MVGGNLKSLNISHCDITDEGCRYLAQALQHNQCVSEVLVEGNALSFNALKELRWSLAVCSSRKELDISYGGTQVTPISAVAHKLMNNASIMYLNISGNTVSLQDAHLLASVFAKNFAIKKLHLTDNKMGGREASVLFESFKNNRTIAELFCGTNAIGDVGATALSSLLEINDSLRRVDISNNGIGSTGGTALANALAKNKHVQELNLSYNMLGSDAGCRVAAAIKDNPALEKLNIAANGVGHYAATSFADTLKTNRIVSSLDLGFNGVLDSGATALSMALKKNRALISLNLWRDGIGPAGAEELFNVCRENETLEDLQLGNAASAGGDTVGAGSTGMLLSIAPGTGPVYKRQGQSHIRWNNCIGDGAAGALARALRDNNKLRSVDVRETNIHESAGAQLSEIAGKKAQSLTLSFDTIPDDIDYAAVHQARIAQQGRNVGVHEDTSGDPLAMQGGGLRALNASTGSFREKTKIEHGDPLELHNAYKPSKGV